MRPARRDEDAPQAHQYKSQDERDAALELRYVYDRKGEASTMAFVATYSAELVREFFAWRQGQSQTEALIDALRRWEVKRFGAELDPAPHGAFWFALRWALAPSQGGRYHPPSYADHPEWLRRRAQAHGVIPQDLDQATRRALPDMPTRPTRRETDARLSELGAQAVTLTREP